MTALLAVAQTRIARATLLVPEDADAAAYWSRVGFFRLAEELYVLKGAVPPVSPEADGKRLC